ncbi:hypothetical protein E2C01_066243 [Portunus trituberculatus]|uniref:Uncharacterized protein n=1 Tax=Portunus trituberculatus TaxID=210409 RepID=A0A5B7HGK6_PORTR|nr:hypothetical protein [Portunus trituberculatus]
MSIHETRRAAGALQNLYLAEDQQEGYVRLDLCWFPLHAAASRCTQAARNRKPGRRCDCAGGVSDDAHSSTVNRQHSCVPTTGVHA